MKNFVYNLRDGDDNSGKFYGKLEAFTDQLLNSEQVGSLHELVDSYKQYIVRHEKLRSTNEYIAELLQLGVFWVTYNSYIKRRHGFVYFVLNLLYSFRNKISWLKKSIDQLRGHLISKINYPEKNNVFPPKTLTQSALSLLLKWMCATGDFREEAKRLKYWDKYIRTISSSDKKEAFISILVLAHYFMNESKTAFKRYTVGVEQFKRIVKSGANNHNENQIFITRTEAEYYLNMVCAQIMNIAFRNAFVNTANKAVLLPTCMRSGPKECKATPLSHYFKCARCQSKCHVCKIAKQLQSAEVYLVPHSSGFSKTLRVWANQNQTGLVGVACVLNLLQGGYEMKGLNIPSQCVFLDYCGCKKHWKPYTHHTELNLDRLEKILSN